MATTAKRLIRVTFEVVTPESAEDGDCAESGWHDEDGIECEDVDDAIQTLQKVGPFEASGSHFSCGPAPEFYPHIWYRESDGSTDYSTGAVTTKSYHLYGFNEAEQREIFEAMQS